MGDVTRRLRVAGGDLRVRLLAQVALDSHRVARRGSVSTMNAAPRELVQCMLASTGSGTAGAGALRHRNRPELDISRI